MRRRRTISDREVAALLRAPAENRRRHLLGQAADWRGMWCLRRGHQWLFLDRPGVGTTFPIWPHEPYATAYASGTAADGFEAHAVPLSRWFRELSEPMGGRLVELFPTATDRGVVMTAGEFSGELVDGLAAYGKAPHDVSKARG